MDAKDASQQLILAKSSAASAAGLFALSCADGGPTRTAPEGRVPLDSHPSPAGGTGEGVFACAASSYLKEGNGKSDSDKFFERLARYMKSLITVQGVQQ